MRKHDFGKALGYAPFPLIVLDPQSKLIVWTNKFTRELLSQKSSKLIHRPIEDLLDSESFAKIDRLLAHPPTAADLQKLHEEPLVFVRSGNLPLRVHCKVSEFSFFDHRYCVLWLIEGVEFEEVRRKEEAERQELIHLSRLADIGRLSAGIAHELNNPLMIVQGYAENMGFLIEAGKMDVEDFKLSIGHILKSVKRMTKIISGVKRFVRNDDFNMVKVDLNEIVPEALHLLHSQLQAVDVNLQFRSADPLYVRCDPAQIEQIIVNILNNAIHALESFEGPRKIRIQITEEKGRLILSIWNNGPEIPVEIREKILNPFFTTKQVGEGTGLGLSVSYGIMKAHNGNLRFESSKSDGTCFFLEFPKMEAEIVEIKGRGRVLVVDDEPSFTWLFANKLRLFGFEVLVADSAAEALKLVGKDPELIGAFVDFRMPEMDGLEFTRAMRKLHGSKHLVFLVSGYPLSFTEELAVKRAGVDDILSKPIPVEQLSQMAKMLAGHKKSSRFSKPRKVQSAA